MLQNVFFSVYFYWRHNLQITSDRDFIFLGFLLKAFLQIVLINVDEISPVSDSSLSIVFIFKQIYQFEQRDFETMFFLSKYFLPSWDFLYIKAKKQK